MLMETTFIVNPGEDREFMNQFVQLFSGKKVKITVVEMQEESQLMVQQEVFQQMEGIRKRLKNVQIPLDTDINRLIDEMYDQPL
jgi:hypothetical protein